MAWSQSDVTKLERAIASGVKRVRYSPTHEVEYQSTDEMLRVLETMRAALSDDGRGGAIFAGRIV